MDKKAEKYLTFWWYIKAIIISVVVIISIFMISSTEFDVRKEHSQILASQISECLNNQELKLGDNLLQKCNLNDKFFEKDAYFILETCEVENCERLFSYGDISLRKDCEIKKAVKFANKYPECSNENVVIILNGIKNAKIEVGINKNGK